MLRAVLFDFNGVLVDDEPLHRRLLERVLGEEAIPAEPDWAAAFLGVSDRDSLRSAFARRGRELAPDQLQRLLARKSAYYQQEVRRTGVPFAPGVVEVVGALRGGGLKLGIVTGALRHEVQSALESVGLGSAFDVLVSAEDVEHGKPDPEGYRHALVELNRAPGGADRLVHPHEVLAVEDSPAGATAAAGAGLRVAALGAVVGGTIAAEPLASLSLLTPEWLSGRF